MGKATTFLYLNEEDMIKAGVLDSARCIDVEEERFVNGIGVQAYRMMYEGKLPPITEAVSLGDVICGTAQGRTSDDERICFVTGGLPVWDVGWSYELYQNAKKLGLGQELKLWDSPYLD